MRIENEFVVKAPIDHVWTYLLDVERVAPCMPGAELTEVVDDRTWKGRTNIRIGPVSLSFAGTVVMQERDDQAHRVVLRAEGREQKGKGAASATVVSTLEAVDGGTKVTIDTDLTITGAVAQYGRGMIQDISHRLTREFAQCLEAGIGAAEVAVAAPAAAEAPAPAEAAPVGAGGPGPEAAGRPAAPAPPVARPIRGFRLGLWALWRAIVRFFGRLFGGGGRG
jgi:carbon monoxide dehydrogenase subunit G